MGKNVITSTGPHGTTAHGTGTVTVHQKVKILMQVIVSLLLLIVGLLVLTAPNFAFHQNFDESTKRWAAGWIGAVIGYWLS